MTQYARPDSEVSNDGSWSGAYTTIDEESPSEADYITGSDEANGTVEYSLSNVTDPESDASHIVKYRIWDEGNSFSRGIECRLIENSTVRATWTDTELNHTVEQKEHTLSSGEADSITDYTDLRLRFTSTGDVGTPAPNRSYIYLSWAVLEVPNASANVNVDVPLGTLTITGNAPTVTASDHQVVDVPLGTLGITAYAPTVTVAASVNVDVPLGELGITGYAPTVSTTANVNVAVPLGALSLAGYAPTIATTAHIDIEIPAGVLSITGYAPTVAAGGSVDIPVPLGTLSITGYAPTVAATAHIDVTTPSGVLVVTGYAPAVGATANVDIAVPTGTIVISGYVPTVGISDNIDISTPYGTLELAGYAPIVSVSGGSAPGVATASDGASYGVVKGLDAHGATRSISSIGDGAASSDTGTN